MRSVKVSGNRRYKGSAGEQLASARYEFQSIFKLRGKIDNIIDYNMNKIATIDMVERMSRCMGIAPGRKGILNHDAYKILTDADVDGLNLIAPYNSNIICKSI